MAAPEWIQSSSSQWIADCGPYIGPWPPTAPSFGAVRLIDSDTRIDINARSSIYISYLTAPYVSDPSDLYIGSDYIITWAQMGATINYHNDYYDHSKWTLEPWEGPGYFWDYYDTPPFSLNGPPKRSNLHAYVLLQGNLYDPGGVFPDFESFVRTLDATKLIPNYYTSMGSGPPAQASGTWSDWQPRPTNDYDRTYSWGFYRLCCAPDQWSGWQTNWTDAKNASQSALHSVGIPSAFNFTLDTRYYSHLDYERDTFDEVAITLSATQMQQAVFPYDVGLGAELDLGNDRPPSWTDVMNVVDPDGSNPNHYGDNDPYTPGGFGWQYETRNGDVLGMSDYYYYLQGLAFQFWGASFPTPPRPLPMSNCPMRIFARSMDSSVPEYHDPAWYMTGGYSGPGWLPFDSHAIDLGVHTVPLTNPFGTNGFWSSMTGDRVPMSLIPWRRFWLVACPDYAFSGTVPDPPSWLMDAPSGSSASLFQYHAPITNGYYINQYGFEELGARVLYPRWRYWKPILGDKNPLRFNQRADGLGVFGHPRLGNDTGTAAASNRINGSNTYI